jgi:hypothetical protein
MVMVRRCRSDIHHTAYQTCYRRCQEWVRSEGLEAILKALVQDMKGRGDLALIKCFIDSVFVIAQKGAQG